ncbi:hypothetical protein WN943_018912 [Citrus x changshan-huyou]
MNGGSALSHAGVEKLVGNNYNYWKLCMQAYLQSQDLWSLISGDEIQIPVDNPQNAEAGSKGPVSNARLRRYLIRGLRKEFIPFISSVQGWPNYPSIIELENLLSNLEAIHKQAANNNNSTSQVEDVLYTKDQGKKNYSSKCGKQGHIKRDCRVKVVCNRCGKSGHIKANCRVKLDEAGANVANESKESEQSNWEQCLSIEVIDQPTSMTSVVHQTNAPIDVNAAIDYNKEWIVDSGCSHHTMGNATLLSDVRPYYLMGPIRTPNCTGLHYMIVIVDDFSRFP